MLECFHSKQHEEQLLWIEPWTQAYPWLRAGLTTRNGGFSQMPYDSLNGALHVGDQLEHVLQNRRLLSEMLGLPFEAFTCADQVHGDALVEITARDKGKGSCERESAVQETDGIYTKEQDILLASFYADCVPLYFLAPKQRLIGIAHAGWKGTAAQIGVKMIQLWQRKYALKLEEIYIAIGPSIGQCCYEVGEEVVLQIPQYTDYLKQGFIIKQANSKYTIDLKGINASMLLLEGIKEEQLLCTSYCTSCSPNLFYSHRRDQGRTGRMVAFMAVKEEQA